MGLFFITRIKGEKSQHDYSIKQISINNKPEFNIQRTIKYKYKNSKESDCLCVASLHASIYLVSEELNVERELLFTLLGKLSTEWKDSNNSYPSAKICLITNQPEKKKNTNSSQNMFPYRNATDNFSYNLTFF